MHIALVTPYFPNPKNALGVATGRSRILRLGSALAQEGQVHLFSALVEEDLPAERDRCGGGMEPFARVVTHPLEERAVGGDEPLRVRRFPKKLQQALGAAHNASAFDVVVVVHSYAATSIKYLKNVPVVLDEPEVRSQVELHNLRVQASRVISRFRNVRQWQQYERAVWQEVNAITVARSRDLSVVHSHRGDTGVLIPNGVDLEEIPYVPPSRREGNRVLFAGDMRSPSVVAAAKELAQRVMPKLRVRVPDALLTLAGPCPPKEVLALEGDFVRVIRGVSIRSMLRDHCVFAIPPALRSEGARDVLEPICAGLPVVAPPPALRDIPLVEGRDYVPAHTVEVLADRIAAVLVHRAKMDEVALSARNVMERHDWQEVGERFVRVVMATVSNQPKK